MSTNQIELDSDTAKCLAAEALHGDWQIQQEYEDLLNNISAGAAEIAEAWLNNNNLPELAEGVSWGEVAEAQQRAVTEIASNVREAIWQQLTY